MAITNNPQVQRYLNLVKELGKATLHNLFPDDFEYYMCGLELVDSDEKTVDCLIFPINPDNIQETPTNNVSITKTAGGITVLSDPNFQPVDIQISGNFGRRFKFLVGRDTLVDATAIQYVDKAQSFSKQIKTGYGVTKVLKNLLELSLKPDAKGNAHKLYFYNQAFGTAYIVKLMTPSYKQSVSDSNMIWGYSLTFRAVAPVNNYTKPDYKKTLVGLSSKKVIMQGIDMLSRDISKNLKNV